VLEPAFSWRGGSQESDGLVEIKTADCTDGTDELVAALSEIQPAVVDRRYSTCSGFDSVLSAQSAVSRFSVKTVGKLPLLLRRSLLQLDSVAFAD